MAKFTTQEMKQKREDALRMKADGATQSQIVATLGVSRGSINEWFNGNPAPRSRGAVIPNKAEIAQQVIVKRLEGTSFVRIGRELSISASTARRLFDEVRDDRLTTAGVS